MVRPGEYGFGQFNNYTPHRIPVNGIKVNPYTITASGPVFRNGQTRTPGANSVPALFPDASAVNTPGCHCCSA